jgi:hypothetical protein
MKSENEKQNEFSPADKSGGQQKEIPLCLRCARPVDPLSHYCSHCGETTGQMTPYIPFVNLRMQINFWVQSWHQIWSNQVSLAGRCLRLFMIVLYMPILLLALIPMLWEKLKSKKKIDRL